MSRLPAPLVDKLGRLIPRLASDHDGEILNTVAALRRTLKSSGRDLHDLARSLVPSSAQAPSGVARYGRGLSGQQRLPQRARTRVRPQHGGVDAVSRPPSSASGWKAFTRRSNAAALRQGVGDDARHETANDDARHRVRSRCRSR